jgi:ATP-dependent Lon protease
MEIDNTAVLPTLSIKNAVLFPSILMPLVIGRATSISALDAALATEDKQIAIFTQKDPSLSDPKFEDLYKTGTMAIIKKVSRTNGVVQIEVQGLSRLEWTESVTEQPYLSCHFRHLPKLQDHDAEMEALQRVVIEQADSMLALVRPELKGSLRYALSGEDGDLNQIYLMAAFLPISVEKEMELLEAQSTKELLTLLHEYLKHEIQVLELRNQINSQVQSSMDSEQREYLLRRQLHAIQEQLGEERPEQADVDELRRKLQETSLPDSVRKIIEKELMRLQRMSAASPEYQLTRTYVELAMDLPWQYSTPCTLDLEAAQQLLDAEHFNLKEIKQRIIEHMAVMKLNPNAKSPILCLIGPPGVGKTSVGQSIAHAMGRRFERMSLGGLHDEAELRGHRRTYIGAMPGRILMAIKRAGANNPLLMLDEVDKLGRDFRGDPAAALMEILDPAQNAEFHDNYLDMPFDLSKVFFITTANTLENIPGPLLDRMEVLRISGYSAQEKMGIARQFLLPRQLTDTGLTEQQLSITDDGLISLIRRYTRESGVRTLERTLGSLARKVASQIAKGEISEVVIDPQKLFALLGPEPFREEQIRRPLPAGVAAGLAWTPTGGEVLYVEAALLARNSPLLLTGQLGDVMQESAKIANSFVWSNADKMKLDKAKLSRSSVHIHVPSGAVPKDGPSAGVTMVSALASLYSGKPVRSDVAMTGEITLSGLVLPIGGVKEKVLAAHRAGIFTVILPTDNQKDLNDLPKHVLEVMNFEYIERVDQLLAIAIPQLMANKASAVGMS